MPIFFMSPNQCFNAQFKCVHDQIVNRTRTDRKHKRNIRRYHDQCQWRHSCTTSCASRDSRSSKSCPSCESHRAPTCLVAGRRHTASATQRNKRCAMFNRLSNTNIIIKNLEQESTFATRRLQRFKNEPQRRLCVCVCVCVRVCVRVSESV